MFSIRRFLPLPTLCSLLVAACGPETGDRTAESFQPVLSDGTLNPEEIEVTQLFGIEPSFDDEVVIDEFQHIHAKQVTACAEQADSEGYERLLAISRQEPLPEWANRSTVFLNGWRASYRNGDHHVGSIQAHVVDPNYDRSAHALQFRLEGHLVDKNGDDPYVICYKYVFIAWFDTFVEARTIGSNYAAFHPRGRGSIIERTEGRRDINTALLPTGFRYQHDKDEQDHTLYAITYDLQAHTLGGAGDLPAAIFRDNNGGRPYRFQEWSRVLAGQDVFYYLDNNVAPTVKEPSTRNCVAFGSAPTQTRRVTIPNIPHPFALPVLAGWKMRYGCEDENVERVGAWLQDIEYRFDAATGLGTLTFDVQTFLDDEDGLPGHFGDFRVNVLAFNARRPPNYNHIFASGNLTPNGVIRLTCLGNFASCEVTGDFSHMESGCYLPCDGARLRAECDTNERRNPVKRRIDKFSYTDPSGNTTVVRLDPAFNGRYATASVRVEREPFVFQCDFTD